MTDVNLVRRDKVRHKILGWEGRVTHAKNTGVPWARIKFANGQVRRLPRDTVEKINTET